MWPSRTLARLVSNPWPANSTRGSAALGHLAGAAPPEPPAAAGGTDAPTSPAAPATHADTMEGRRGAALEMVGKYRAAHPGDPRSDDQLLVAPYGGYEMLAHEPGAHAACMERLAAMRPKPAEEPKP
jgi:hypothetical protein